MKKILSLVVIFVVIMPLFSSVVFSEDVPDPVREALESMVETAVGDRRDIEVGVEKYETEEGVVSLTLSFSDKSISIKAPASDLESEIRALFYYEESLMAEGARLDYIYKESFSSISLDGAKRGQNYALIGESGKTEALFSASGVYEEAVTLRPYWLSSPLPGMRIERINDFSLSIRAFSNVKFTSYGTSLSLYYSTFTYPLVPFIEAAVIYDGSFGCVISAGLGASFSFASVWPDAELMRNLSIEGQAALGCRIGAEASLSSEALVALRWTFSRVFSLTAGVVNYSGTNYILLGFGGKL